MIINICSVSYLSLCPWSLVALLCWITGCPPCLTVTVKTLGCLSCHEAMIICLLLVRALILPEDYQGVVITANMVNGFSILKKSCCTEHDLSQRLVSDWPWMLWVLPRWLAIWVQYCTSCFRSWRIEMFSRVSRHLGWNLGEQSDLGAFKVPSLEGDWGYCRSHHIHFYMKEGCVCCMQFFVKEESCF